MLLYYRFSSEHAGSYRQCALSSSALSLRETKQLLANECGLAGEYLRKIDFRIFVAGERRKTQHQHVGSTSSEGGGAGVGEEELMEVVDEHQMIHAYSYLVVQRVGLMGERVGGVYVHTLAKRQLSKEAWRCEEEIYLQRTGATRAKKPVPPEWLCGLCDGVMTQPVLVKCLGSCTQSACRSCLEAALRAARGSCPFCGAGFRQVIRNKRLEEIINHANLQEFEIPPPSAAPHQKAIDRATAAREKGGKGGGDDAGARGGGAGRGTGSCIEGSSQKSEGTPAVLRQQTAAGRGEKGGTGRGVHVKVGSCDRSSSQTDGEGGQSPTETPFQHFVYLLPQKNLQLMRARDLMLVDGSSALAAALSAAPSSAQGADDAGAGASATGGLPEAEISESDVDLEGRDAFLVPLCASGGGTSFCIGGFVRINSHNKVDISSDRVAQNVARQWQQVSNVGSSLHGGDQNVTSNIFLYRVNWLEKYGTMPMLPSRKQPLGGLVGANRRPVVTSFGLGSGSNSNLVPGLVQRSLLPFATLEVVVAPSKFEDVIASIRDYAQFGSRPTDPWQYPASNSTVAGAPTSAPSTPATAVAVSAPGAADASTGASTSHKALPAAAHRAAHTAAGDTGAGVQEVYPPPVPPPPPPVPPGGALLPPYYGHKIVSGEVAVSGEGGTVSAGTTVAFGGGAAGGAASSMFSGMVALDESSRNVVTHEVTHEGESEPHAGIPAALGPPPLDLYGGPGEEANPYMGYCAILPFLTEEQFWHIRRMQKKAIRLCGYKRPTCNSTTSSSSPSSKEGRERRRGVTRSSKRRRQRVLNTESSTGSDSSYGTSNSEEQRKGREVSLSKGSTFRPGERTSKERAARGGKVIFSPVAVVPSDEVTSALQTPCESRVDVGDAASANTTDRSDTSSLQRRGSVGTPSLRKDTVNMATRARARPVAGKPLPVVPPPLSSKHAGNPGSPRTGASLSAKAKEDTPSKLRPVKPEP